MTRRYDFHAIVVAFQVSTQETDKLGLPFVGRNANVAKFPDHVPGPDEGVSHTADVCHKSESIGTVQINITSVVHNIPAMGNAETASTDQKRSVAPKAASVVEPTSFSNGTTKPTLSQAATPTTATTPESSDAEGTEADGVSIGRIAGGVNSTSACAELRAPPTRSFESADAIEDADVGDDDDDDEVDLNEYEDALGELHLELQSNLSTASPADDKVVPDMAETPKAVDTPKSAKIEEPQNLENGAPPVQVDLCLEPFLAAVTELVNIFDAIGSPFLSDLVRKDALTKVAIVRDAVARHTREAEKRKPKPRTSKVGDAEGTDAKPRFDTVRRLLQAEREYPPSGLWAPQPAAPALLWMVRVLDFIERLVANLLGDRDKKLAQAALEAYNCTMRPGHSMITRGVFEKAFAFVPERKQFEAQIDPENSKVLAEFVEFERHVRPHVATLYLILSEEAVKLPTPLSVPEHQKDALEKEQAFYRKACAAQSAQAEESS